MKTAKKTAVVSGPAAIATTVTTRTDVQPAALQALTKRAKGNVTSIVFCATQTFQRTTTDDKGAKVKQPFTLERQHEYTITRGTIDLPTAVSNFAAMLQREADKVARLKAAGFTCKGFNMSKPFALSIKADQTILFDTTQLQAKSWTNTILQGKHGARIADALHILAETAQA